MRVMRFVATLCVLAVTLLSASTVQAETILTVDHSKVKHCAWAWFAKSWWWTTHSWTHGGWWCNNNQNGHCGTYWLRWPHNNNYHGWRQWSSTCTCASGEQMWYCWWDGKKGRQCGKPTGDSKKTHSWCHYSYFSGTQSWGGWSPSYRYKKWKRCLCEKSSCEAGKAGYPGTWTSCSAGLYQDNSEFTGKVQKLSGRILC